MTNMLPINIIQKICYKTDNPLEYKRVNKTWNRALSQTHFWREFVCRKFMVDPKKVGLLRPFENDWRKCQLIKPSFLKEKTVIVSIQDWDPLQGLDMPQHYKYIPPKDMITISLYPKLLKYPILDLGIVPVIIRGRHFPPNDRYGRGEGLGQLTIPLCPQTQLFFKKFLKLESEIKKTAAHEFAKSKLKSRIKNNKWFNIALDKRHGYLRVQTYNPTGCANKFSYNRITTYTQFPKTFKWVTNAHVFFGANRSWARSKFYGVAITSLVIVVRPSDVPPGIKVEQHIAGKHCCVECRNEQKWNEYQAREGDRLVTRAFQTEIGLESAPIEYENAIEPTFDTNSSDDDLYPVDLDTVLI